MNERMDRLGRWPGGYGWVVRWTDGSVDELVKSERIGAWMHWGWLMNK